jgi:hypothetical protein
VLFPDSPTLAGRGWLCNAQSTDSPEVCVNNDGIALVNVTQFLVLDAAGNVTAKLTPASFASTIAKKSCKDTPFCLWGSIAGAVLATIVTLGVFAEISAAADAVLLAEQLAQQATAIVEGAVATGEVLLDTSLDISLIVEVDDEFAEGLSGLIGFM